MWPCTFMFVAVGGWMVFVEPAAKNMLLFCFFWSDEKRVKRVQLEFLRACCDHKKSLLFSASKGDGDDDLVAKDR